MAYFIFDNPLSTAVIAPVDSHGNPFDTAFSHVSSSDSWSVMIGPNPQFSDQLSPFLRMTDEEIGKSSHGSCDPLGILPCEGTTDPDSNKYLIIRGNRKRIMYLPWHETSGVIGDCIDP